jgi:glycerol-3-phosphate dehydrogenase
VVSPSGLVTVVGGKWTTYRRMARDAVDRAAVVGRLAPVACPTASIPVTVVASAPGDDSTEATVRHAVREEMARTVEDVLARRSRLLITDARAARAAAADVARVMAGELGRDASWEREQVASFAVTVEKHLPR